MGRYLWSVLLGHVHAGFPYISDIGTYPPESCLFGLLLALYSAVTTMTAYIRWQQVKTFCESCDGSRAIHRANNAGLVLGLITAFGILIVANFQKTDVRAIHLLGAMLAMGVGSFYAWVQTFISYKMPFLPGHRARLRHFRLVLSVICTIACILFVTLSSTASQKLGAYAPVHGNNKWTSDIEGFTEYVVSSAIEWLLAFTLAIFVATYYTEFRCFTFTLPVEFTADTTRFKVTSDNGEKHLSTAELQPSSSILTVASVTS